MRVHERVELHPRLSAACHRSRPSFASVGEGHRSVTCELHQRGRALELRVVDELRNVELAFVEADRADVEATALLDELVVHALDWRLLAVADGVDVAA